MNLKTYNKYKLLSRDDREEYISRFSNKPDWDSTIIWFFLLVIGMLSAGFFLSMSVAMNALDKSTVLPFDSSITLAHFSLGIVLYCGCIGLVFSFVYNISSVFKRNKFLKEKIK